MTSLPVWLPGPMFLIGGVSVWGEGSLFWEVSVWGGLPDRLPQKRHPHVRLTMVGTHPTGMISC